MPGPANRQPLRPWTHTGPAAYAPHAGFIAPALGTPGLRPVILAFILIESLYGLAQNGFGWLLETLAPELADAYSYGDTAAGMLVQLFSFTLLGLTVVMVVERTHGRGFFSLTGPPMTGLRQFRAVFWPLAALFVLLEILPPWWSADALAQVTPPLVWLLLLPLSILALTIQTGAEELLYRGYLQQQIAAWDNRPWVWLILPNILFGLAHLNVSGPFPENLHYVLWAFCFGLAASDLTARSGTLGPALAFHLVNNVYAFLFFGEDGGPDSGLALLLFNSDAVSQPFSDLMADAPLIPFALIIEIGLVALMWLVARLALRR